MTAVDFFFDLSSPYSFLAESQMAGLAKRTGCEVIYRPMVLSVVFRETHNHAPLECPAKARYMGLDLYRWAARYEIEFQFSSHFPLNTMSAMRLILALKTPAERRQMAHQLFRAVWVQNQDISDEKVLFEVVAQTGLVSGPIEPIISDPEVKLALRKNTEEAVARGAFGAPTIFVGSQMFCGNDRLDFVEAAIRATG